MGSRFSTDDLGRAADPATRECDWCEESAVCAFEVFKTEAQVKREIGTGQFVYPCRNHERIARESSRAPKRAR